MTTFKGLQKEVHDGYHVYLDDEIIASIFYHSRWKKWVIAEGSLMTLNFKTEILFKANTLEECKEEASKAYVLRE